MSVRSAGRTIREARKKAGLSQEKLSEGICSLISLSRIETGTAGVSPSTFQALMARAGAPCEIFPIFENWNDYECFFSLVHARFHLDAWQLSPAFEELERIERKNWNHNKLYYQHWLLLHGILQFRSGKGNHQQIYDTLMAALHITKPNIDFMHYQNLLLSVNEIELLIFIAQELLYMEQGELCNAICTQIYSCLSGSQITFTEKDKLLAEYAIVYTKYLVREKDYILARNIADQYRHQMVLNQCDAPLLELTFLTGLCDFYLGRTTDASGHFKDTFYSAHAISSPYATVCKNYITENSLLELPESLSNVPDIPLENFPTKKNIDSSDFSDGVYDFYEPDIVTVGVLIRELRLQQKISQQTLCQGLCSKSKLSKIEKGTLNPDIILAQALLQRLGISEREFVFWGNEKDTKFHEYIYRLKRLSSPLDHTQQKLLNEFKQLVTEKDTLYRQHLLFEESYLIKDPEQKILFLKDALRLTLKNFDIYKILQYRLSWTELTLLNAIALTYRFTSTPYLGILYFRYILDYQRTISPDCILQSQTLSATFHLYFRLLYSQGHHKELIDICSEYDMSILKYRIHRCGMVNFYYSQSLGECKQYEKMILPARYAYAINQVLELPENAFGLKKYIWEDFSIDIDY